MDFIWNNQNIGGGKYDIQGEGMKNGFWTEPAGGFTANSQVFTNGWYKNGNKVGRWDVIFRGQQIGYGSYEILLHQGSIKIGRWIELSNGFYDDSQVTFVGEYENGKKVGQWDIFYQENQQDKEKQKIGGGIYVQQEDQESQKIGKWIELNDGFYYNSQVTHVGEYKNGRKIGKWVIIYRGLQIGGGTYEIFFTEDSIKTGKWIELSDGFNDDQQITYVGEYSNNKKFGKWDSFYRFYLFEWKKIAIGGGSYDDNVLGDSVKFGEWVEQSEGFNWNSYVTYHGIYKNGKKSGEWKACWRSYFEKWSFNVIGEGSYDDSVKGDSVKIGWSDEQSEGYQRTSQVTYQGDYNNGMKVGKWNIKFQGSNVGGGFYDKQGSIKCGEWIELSDRFGVYSFVTYNGIYKNGRKAGYWCIEFGREIVGGGLYDNNGSFKNGKWIELSDSFYCYSQVTYQGEYKNCKKVGIWVILGKIQGVNQEKGGGEYDDQLDCVNSLRNGLWIELSDEFDELSQIIYKGEYKHGKKIGVWDEINFKKNEKCGQLNYEN